MKIQIKVQDSTQIITFISFYIDNLVNIIWRLTKLIVLILAMIVEGNVSKIFIKAIVLAFKNIIHNFLKMFSDFLHKIKTKT